MNEIIFARVDGRFVRLLKTPTGAMYTEPDSPMRMIGDHELAKYDNRFIGFWGDTLEIREFLNATICYRGFGEKISEFRELKTSALTLRNACFHFRCKKPIKIVFDISNKTQPDTKVQLYGLEMNVWDEKAELWEDQLAMYTIKVDADHLGNMIDTLRNFIYEMKIPHKVIGFINLPKELEIDIPEDIRFTKGLSDDVYDFIYCDN